MANGVLSIKNYIDDATLSNGLYYSAYPVTEVAEPYLNDYARTQNVQTSSTCLDANLGTGRGMRLFGLFDCNFSLDAMVRVKVSDVSNFSTTIYNSDWMRVFDEIYPFDQDVLEWEDDQFWTGTPTDDDLEGYKRNFVLITPDIYAGQYVRFEVDDQDNPAGYLDIGRAWAGPAWQFLVNYDYGETVGFEDPSLVDKSLGGKPFFEERTKNRFQRFSLGFMQKNEAYLRAFETMRRQGITKEVVFSPDPEDGNNGFRRNILGRMRALQGIENFAVDLFRTAFELEELI